MNDRLRIIKNIFFQVGGSLLEKFLGFVLTLLIARHLGDVGLGQYSFAFVFVTFFHMVSEFGIETFIFRELAKYPHKKQHLMNSLFTLKCILTLIFVVVLAPLVFFLTKHDPVMLQIIILTAVALFADTLRYTVALLFTALESVELTTLTVVFERLFSLALAVVMLPRYGLQGLLYALIISYGITFCVAYVLAYFKYNLSVGFNFVIKEHLHILKKSFPFWLTLVFSFIYFRIDTLMLGYMKDYAVVGWYTAAYSLVLGLNFIGGGFVMVIFPVMSRYYQHRQITLLKNLYHVVMYYMLVVGIPLAVGTTLLAHDIIVFIFKEAFAPAAIALQILIWSELFYFVNNVMGYTLNSIHKEKKFTLVTGISALVNVILNFILIPTYSYVGAGIATVISFALALVLMSWYCHRYGYRVNLFVMALKPCIAAVVMALAIFVGVYFLPTLHVLLSIILGGSVYLITLLVIGGLGKREWELLTSLLSLAQQQRFKK